MMDIKTSSWHYRLINFFFSKTPRSLCPYFWKVVGALIIAATISTALFGVVFGTGMLFLKQFGVTSGFWFFAGSPVIGAISIVVGIVVMIAFFELSDYINDKIKKAIANTKPVEDKEPSLVVSFLKSKKEKICPNLKFVD